MSKKGERVQKSLKKECRCNYLRKGEDMLIKVSTRNSIAVAGRSLYHTNLN